MAEEEWIVSTQETLGKLISKPKMTEKYLKKPPFRFLHDIVIEVSKATGFAQGLFSGEESDAGNLSDKQAKIDFLNKAISCVCFALDEKIDVAANKIVAGLDADKTNVWLQKLHQAATSALDKSPEAVARVLAGDSVAAPKKQKEKTPAAGDDAGAAGADDEAKREEERRRRAEKKKRDEEKRRKAEEAAAAEGEVGAAEPAPSPPPDGGGEDDEQKRLEKEEERRKRQEERKRREEKKQRQAEEEEARRNAEEEARRNAAEDEAAAAANAAAQQQAAAEAQAAAMAQQQAALAAQQQAAAYHDQHPADAPEDYAAMPSAPGSAAQGTRPPMDDPSAAQDDMAGAGGDDMGGGVGVPRKLERPRTAGRRPPKVASKVTTRQDDPGGVANAPAIIAEGATKDDDDEDMFEAPQMPGGTLQANVPGAQHGQLVQDLLAEKKREEERIRKEEEDTREEVEENGAKGIKMGRLKRKKEGASSLVDIDVGKLGESIQHLCQAANPLGKSIDLVHQDIANMGKELDTWKQQYHEASEQFARELKMTDELLQPLYQKVAELDDKNAEQVTKIRNIRSRIAKNDLKVQSLLDAVVTAK